MLIPRFGSSGEGWTYYRGDGREFGFRLKDEVLDDSELLAQGRHAENARRKRAINSLPLFESRAAAQIHFDKVI